MKLISKMTPEEFARWQADTKRKQDEIARSRGFRDYAEMSEYVP